MCVLCNKFLTHRNEINAILSRSRGYKTFFSEINSTEHEACADPESFVIGCSTLRTFINIFEDPITTLSGPLSTLQRNAI